VGLGDVVVGDVAHGIPLIVEVDRVRARIQARSGWPSKRAKLPPHFTPHSLRHTFASLLLQQGESPVYVQRQLGHASIKLTVDTDGKWLPMGKRPP
jgi:integrase